MHSSLTITSFPLRKIRLWYPFNTHQEMGKADNEFLQYVSETFIPAVMADNKTPV